MPVDFPNEILLEIFEIGSYIEFIEGYKQRQWYPSVFRRPKRFVAPLMMVCSKWRALVQEHGILWITSINVGYDTHQDEELQMLQSSGGSDLDIRILLNPISKSLASKAMKFLIINLIPLSQQWRSFQTYGFSQETFAIIWQELNRFHSLPRLLYIDLRSSTASCLPPLLPSLPRLTKLCSKNLSWGHDCFPFSNLNDIFIAQGKAEPFTLKSLQTALFPSSRTLRCLVLHVNLEEQRNNVKLTFPFLTEFIIGQVELSNAVVTLANFQLPELNKLGVTVTSDSDLSRLAAAHDQILLSKIQQLVLRMPALSVVKLCTRLKAPMLYELRVEPTAFDGIEMLPEDPCPIIHFPSLQSIICTRIQYQGHGDIVTYLLLQFDLSHIIKLHLNYVTRSLTRTFTFPNLETLEVNWIEELQYIDAPCLEMLVIREYSDGPFPEDWIATFQKSPIGMNRIEELFVCVTISSHRLPDRMGSVFPKLEKLTLRIYDPDNLPDELSNGFPLLRDCQLLFPRNFMQDEILPPQRVTEIKTMVEQRIAAGIQLLSLRLCP